jgi:hypothetical protein
MLQENLQISRLVRAVKLGLEAKDPYIVAKFAAILFVAALSIAGAQVVTGQLGSADATTTIDGKQLPAPPPKFARSDQGKRQGLDALVAAAHRAAQGRAQRSSHHDR